MVTFKAFFQFWFMLCVYGDRLRQLEKKMFAMQTMTYQDMSLLRESVDRNFDELKRLASIINASLSQNIHLYTSIPASTAPPETESDSEEENSRFEDKNLVSEFIRLKRGFKDQKLFFHSWREDLGTRIDDLNKGISEQSNEIAGKVTETRDAVTNALSLTRLSSDDVLNMTGLLNSIADNVTDIQNRALLNTIKLDELSEQISNFSETVISSINNIRDNLNESTTGKDVVDTCSEAVRNSEKMMKLLSKSGSVFKEVRLADGSSSYGRLEVFVDGDWGTVCDDEFGSNEANVACKMLGFTGSTDYRINAYYGQGTGPILFDNVKCNGDEKSLFSCEIDYDTSDCQHAEDVGVTCEE